MDIHKVCSGAILAFGTTHQKQKAIEELSELIAELARETTKPGEENIREELADVIIMCEQLKIILDNDQKNGENSVDDWIRYKIRRLELIVEEKLPF